MQLCVLLTQDEELYCACGQYGSLKEARLLLQKGANPNWKSRLHVSEQVGSSPIEYVAIIV